MEPIRERRWNIMQPDEALVGLLSNDCSINPILAALLVNRGIISPDAARVFLSSTLTGLHDPFLLRDMEKAVERLVAAVLKGEKICVYGDYDVDGVTSVALIAGFLREIGADCDYYIPNRIEEGYGLHQAGIDNSAAKGVRVIVSADCGITACAEADYCSSLGVDLIITDHHMPAAEIPAALAVINPLQPDCPFPCKSLAGVGVAFNLVAGLRSRLRQVGFFQDIREPNLREFLDLVALGTIADIVPLVDENRIMVAFGLRELTDSRRTGVQALKDIAGITGEVDCGSVGFRLAPRLNAAGRLEDASFGVELLLTSDVQRAKTLAASLDASNKERQAIEQEILADAVARVKNDPSLNGRKSIVLASDTWHCGVVGIVASRLVELFHRPTILISLQEENGKGSGRSIPGFHLRDALLACSEHLVRFGGHKYAAGLTIESNTLEVFAERFDEIASGILSPEDLLPEIKIDAILSPDRISIDLAEQVSSLEPFGMGNPRPVFAMRGVELSAKNVFKDRHVRLRLGSDGFSFDAVGFSMADRMPDSDFLDVAFSLEIDSWNGRKKIRLKLKDVRKSGRDT